MPVLSALNAMHDQKAWCRFSEEDIEGMVGRPLTLFLTKLTSMTPTLREVNALCAMHTPVSYTHLTLPTKA